MATKTNTLAEAAKIGHSIGDTLNDKFIESNDIKVAEAAIRAYNLAVSCKKTEILHKKLTGMPDKIEGIS